MEDQVRFVGAVRGTTCVQAGETGWGGLAIGIRDDDMATLSIRIEPRPTSRLRTLAHSWLGLDDSYFLEIDDVDLSATNASDADVARLRALPGLARLDLSGTHVTDDCLTDIVAHRNLKYLDIENTNITDDGAQFVRDILPDCYVRRR
ncbi:MAG: hypothetical protein HYS13_02940 [Planctomycetia bacterium]|nr:hypothetical protein [Planctomycetia bacterium]